jgi:DUF971 family protein
MSPIPSHIQLHQKSKVLDLIYEEGHRGTQAAKHYQLPCEYLRIYSPSAEVRGHGKGQEVLQTGKQDVNITHIEPSGQYGLKLSFDDGHNTGIYTWDYLYDLCLHQEVKWNDYLLRMHQANASRIKDANVVQLITPNNKVTPNSKA